MLQCAVVHCGLFIYIDIYFGGCSHKHCQHNNKHPNHQHHYPNPSRKLSYLHASPPPKSSYLSRAQEAKTFSLAHSGRGRSCLAPRDRPPFNSACLCGDVSRVPTTRPPFLRSPTQPALLSLLLSLSISFAASLPSSSLSVRPPTLYL